MPLVSQNAVCGSVTTRRLMAIPLVLERLSDGRGRDSWGRQLPEGIVECALAETHLALSRQCYQVLVLIGVMGHGHDPRYRRVAVAYEDLFSRLHLVEVRT